MTGAGSLVPLSGHDLDHDGSLPRAVVEVDEDQLLPGPEREPPALDRHDLGRADDRGPLVGVRVAVVVQAVVLIVAAGRRSCTPPGSYSIVVIAAVDPRTNADASPSAAPAAATASRTLRVMSTMSESPPVESWISLVWTGMPVPSCYQSHGEVARLPWSR